MSKLLALLLTLLAIGVLLPLQAADSQATPVLFESIALPADVAAEELARLRRQLVQLPRRQFDDLVQQADAARNPPRLTESRYRARLVETALEGTSEWKIVHPGSGAAVLPLQPLGLAVRQARWRGGAEAILATLEGAPGLLVEQTGERMLDLNWSARGSAVPGGLRFTLEVPPCAIGVLELELPSDRTVSVARDAFHLSGPLPAATANHQLWRIGFSGRTQIGLSIRRTSGPGLPPPLILARLQSRQTINPGELEADFDFELEVLNLGVAKLVCDCDAGLRPYQVAIRNLESWALKPGKTPASPSQIHIQLREPFQGGVLQVKCLASVTPGGAWTAPGIRLVGAVLREETLSLQTEPDIQLEDWQAGGFRLLRSSVDARGQRLTLAAGTEAGPNPPRPKAKLVAAGPEYGVRQSTWWDLAADRQLLVSRLAVEVSRGRLYRLPLQLPPGWDVEQVELAPAEHLGHWTVIPDKAKPLLQVELQRSIESVAPARLTVKLKREAAGAGVWPFPDVVPLGARQREGALGISVHSALQASVAGLAAAPGGVDEQALPRPAWGKQTLDHHFLFKGRPVDGTLTCRGRPSRVRAACGQDVALAGGRALLVTRLELHPEVGTPQSIDLFVSADPGRWEWKTTRGSNQVERVERLEAVRAAAPLALLAARNGWQAAGLTSLHRLGGNYWRLTLARPLTEPLTLEARQELPGRLPLSALVADLALLASRFPLDAVALRPAVLELAESKGPLRVWDVPLVCCPGADLLDGLVTLHLTGSDLVQVESQGLREAAGARPRGPVPAPWKTFRYGQPPVRMTLRSSTAGSERGQEAAVEAASLDSYLEPTGRLVHHFRFRLRDWRQQTVAIRLPSAAQLLSARTEQTWITRMPVPRRDGAWTEYELPAAGQGLQQFELVYASPASPFTLWQRLDGPAPELPVQPLSLERTWHLPPGVAPLAESGWQPRPGSRSPPRWLPRVWVNPEPESWQEQQEQILTEAILAVRKAYHAGETWTLGQLLEEVAISQLRERATLVIDTDAVADLGIQAGTPMPPTAWEGKAAPWSPTNFPLPVPWESLELVYVPCAAAPVLTSRGQQLSWLEDPESLQAGGLIESAIREAARYGQDRSGRFKRVVEWLEQRSSPATETASQAPLIAETAGEGWTEWTPLPGTVRPDSLLVIRLTPLPLAGIVLGIVLALASIRLRPQPGRRRYRLFVIWLAVGGLGLLWLPAPLRPLAWGPACVGLVVGLIWCLRLAIGLRRAAAAAGLTGLALIGSHGLQAARQPVVVYTLPATESRAAFVLAPAELLAQLRKLAQAEAMDPCLVAADYRGKVDGGQILIEARYRLHSFQEGPAAVAVPLTGVQLLDAMVDNRPAQPVAQEGGYAIRVAGAGEHQLLLRFAVTPPGPGEERDLRFGIPEIAQSRLTLEAPLSASFLHVVEARGAQRVVNDRQTQRLEADLGAVASVRVRWRQQEAKSPPAAIQVREGYYWELKAGSTRLLAVLQYSVSQGWLNRVAIDLPRELEVASVDAGPTPFGQPAPRLKDWSLLPDGEKRRLEIEFAGPVTSSVQVTLELVPRQPLGRAANLLFPTPVEGQPGRGFLAYRLEDLESLPGQEKALAITGMRKEEQEAAFQEWLALPWSTARQEKLQRPQRYFWRLRGGMLQLALQPGSALPTCRQEVNWQVDARQATLRAALQWTAPDPRISMVQWEVPGNLVVADLSGPLLAQWTRTGNRIQAWLSKPAAEVNLQLTGWLPRPPKSPPRFDIPLVRCLDAAATATTLKVSAGEGMALTPGALSNLTPRTELDVPGKDWNYLASQENYGGSFNVQPAGPNAYFHVLTFAEVRDRQLAFESTIEGTIHRGELRRLQVSLRHWDGDVVLSAGAGKVEERKLTGGRSWVIELPPGVTRQYSLRLRGQLPLDAAGEVRMPDLRVDATEDGPALQERWLGVAGNDLEILGAMGLEAVPDPGTAFRSWPREADRLRRTGGAGWKVAADDWRLRLLPRGLLSESPIQLLLAEHAAALAANQRWLHRITYRLAHEGGADLSLALRGGARILSVRVNQVPVPLLQSGSNRLWLPLPGVGGVQVVEMAWVYDPGLESIDQPILDLPLLEGVADGPAVWMIQVPAGYQLRNVPRQDGAARPSPAVCLDLARAEAALTLLAWIVERSSAHADTGLAAELASADHDLQRRLRHAQYRLALAGDAEDADALARWHHDLRQKQAQMQQQPLYQALRRQGLRERPLPADSPAGSELAIFDEGRPAYWYGAVGSTEPKLKLMSEEVGRLRQAVVQSALLLALLLASWVLAAFFGAAAWPEQLALLGGLGWLLLGSEWILLLPAAWVLIRCGELAYLAWQRLPRPAVEDSQSA